MGAVTDLKLLIRKQWSNEYKQQEIVDTLIEASLERGAQRFSKWLPIENLHSGNLTINPTDEYLSLPTNYFFMPLDELYTAISGIRLDSKLILSVNNFDYSSLDLEVGSTFAGGYYSNFQSFVGASNTDYSTDNLFQDYKVKLRLSNDDQGRYCVRFGGEFGSTKVVKFFYNGFHEVAESPSKYSIPIPYRFEYTELVLGEMCLAMHRRVAGSTKEEQLKHAFNWLDEARYHFSCLKDVGSLGERG